MKNYKLLAFFLFSLSLLSFVYFDYQKSLEDKKKEKTKNHLVSNPPSFDDLQEVKMQGFLFSFHLMKKKNKWSLKNDPSLILEEKVRFFFDHINQSEVTHIGDHLNLSEYGFSKGAFRINFYFKGQKMQIKVSSKKAYDGTYYISYKDSLYIGKESYWAGIVGKDPNSFKDPRLYPNGLDLSFFSIRHKKTYLRFDQKNNVWKSSQLKDLDQKKIKKWIQSLQSLKYKDLFYISKKDKRVKKYKIDSVIRFRSHHKNYKISYSSKKHKAYFSHRREFFSFSNFSYKKLFKDKKFFLKKKDKK